MKKIRSRSTTALFEGLESRLLLSAAPILPALSKPHSQPRIEVNSFRLRNKTSPNITLAAPGNVTASALSSSKVNVAWTMSSGATGYYIYRSTNGGAFVKLTKVGFTNAFADTTVAGNTNYSYYVVSCKNNIVSAASNITSVTTPAPVIVTLPNAPTNLAVTGSTTHSISLSWTDAATNESGYRVYRSTDGANYTQVASLAAGSSAYTDGALAAGTQYFYKIGARNSAGESPWTAVSGSTVTVVPSGTPINIFTRYGGELVLAGTSGNDSIYVSQSGSTLTIVANGFTSTTAAPANGLFIYSFGGSDTITVDASVTLRATIASIDGSATSISNGDVNAGIWLDSTDGFSGVGLTHKVSSFYQNVSKAIGIDLVDPTDSSSTVKASGSLWGSGPVMGDVNQGSVGDCYFLASLAAFANTIPAKLQSMAVDLGDGTYAVEYRRSGISTVVRVDADMRAGGFGGYAYAHPGSTGDLWAMVMEKSYAYFRSGSNTWASLNSGWMGAVYSDLGINNTGVSLSTSDSSFYTAMSNDLASGKPVTFGTFSSGTSLVSNHAYSLVSVSIIGGVNYYTVRNPWGVSGDSLENSAGYATLTFAQMVANFQLGTAAT